MGNYGYSGPSLAAGLMQGFAKGRQLKMLREDAKLDRADRKELHDLEKLDMQRKAKNEEMLYKRLETLGFFTPQEPVEPPPSDTATTPMIPPLHLWGVPFLRGLNRHSPTKWLNSL